MWEGCICRRKRHRPRCVGRGARTGKNRHMNDLELAKKEFFAKNWEAGIAAAKKTNMEDPVLRYFFGYCREHGYGMERNDADAVRTARRGRRRTDGDGCGVGWRGFPFRPRPTTACFPEAPERARRRGVPVWKLLTPPPPLFGDFPPSVRRENLLYYPPTSEPL